jgi:hypothetical protein
LSCLGDGAVSSYAFNIVVSTASHMICTDYLRLISGPKVTLWQLTSVSVEDDSKRSMLKLSRRTNIMHLRTRQSMQYCIYTTCTFHYQLVSYYAMVSSSSSLLVSCFPTCVPLYSRNTISMY